MKLSKRLGVIFLMFAIIPALFVGSMFFYNARNILENQVTGRLERIADLKVDIVKAFFDDLSSDIATAQTYLNIKTNLPIVSNLSDDKTNPNYQEAKLLMDSQLKDYADIQHFFNIMLTDENGKIVYVTKKERESVYLNKSAASIDKNVFEKGKDKAYFSDIFIDKTHALNYEILVSAPVHNIDKKFIGVVIFEIDMMPVYDTVQDIVQMGKTGETLLGKKYGDRVLYLNILRHDKSAALSRTSSINDKNGFPIHEAAQGRSGYGVSTDYRGKQVLAAWRYIDTIGWGLVAKMDIDEAYAPVAYVRNMFLILMIITVIIAIIAALLVANTIVGPIATLRKVTEMVGGGDMSYKASTSASDELGELSRAFDEMTAKIRISTTSIDKLNKEIAERHKAEMELREKVKQLEIFNKAAVGRELKMIELKNKIADMEKRTKS